MNGRVRSTPQVVHHAPSRRLQNTALSAEFRRTAPPFGCAIARSGFDAWPPDQGHVGFVRDIRQVAHICATTAHHPNPGTRPGASGWAGTVRSPFVFAVSAAVLASSGMGWAQGGSGINGGPARGGSYEAMQGGSIAGHRPPGGQIGSGAATGTGAGVQDMSTGGQGAAAGRPARAHAHRPGRAGRIEHRHAAIAAPPPTLRLRFRNLRPS